MITLQEVELGVLGPLQVRQYGLPVAIPGAKSRAVLTMLGLRGGSVVSADVLVMLLWGDHPPRTATKALQTHISSLRRALGDGFVLTEGTGWTLNTTHIDALDYQTAAKLGRKAFADGDPTRAVSQFDQALALWRGLPELPDSSRGSSEKTRWLEGHAALVEDRADALLATGRAAEIVGELESAIAEAPLRERRWGHLMLALYRAGRQGEALGAYRRARSLLAEELGVDPGPELHRLEAAIVAQDAALEVPQSQQLSPITRAVTFLLTDIEGSTAAWEADADAMAAALARHDEIVEQVVTSRGGRLVKTRGEGDATFSVFDRPSAAAAAAIELQGAIAHEPWALRDPMRIRVALHTGEVEFRDGDYFGRAVNRAARLRSLATGGQILCSGATAELVIDSLPDDVVLADLGLRLLRNLSRPEHVFELRMETAEDPGPPTAETPMERPALPAVLVGPGPFVGRSRELERLVSAWQSTLAAGTHAVLIAGEPGVGKTRLAGEWSRQAYEQGAVVLYGRCDEDLGAPYQPFAEALRSLVSCVDPNRLRSVRGVESLLPLMPGLGDVLPDVAVPPRADPDTERYAMFDAVVAFLGAASATAPVVLILDDLHWAAKPTLLLLRHLLRFSEGAHVQIVGTYRNTDLDRSHPLAAMLADLHRDGTARRLQLSGLDERDVTTYVAEAGYDDEELGRALATVTGGNPFFLIEALRHVEESGGRWDPSTLPQGVREAVSRRLSRLTAETNKALAAAAVVGSRFALTLVEQVVGEDLVDAFDEAEKAGIVIEEPGGRYRFNHALVRQSLLAELPSVRRMRLHQRIAGTLEAGAGADDELLAELAYHYFECAWAGNAAKAVEYCRRAADQAMSRVAYEGAADLYDRALHALEDLDDEIPNRDELQAELLIARCEALLAAGDVTSAKDAVTQLRTIAADSGRLGAWGICFDGELSMLTDPERLDDIESAVGVAAERLAALDDPAGEAKAHTVRAGCLARLGRIGDCETALDQALTAARGARDHSRVNAVLAGAPLAALWGPNPVPRAGGRCLDVVRLLRITTGSPLVEATSMRCQAVLDAFRGRAAEARRLIESARRTLAELGLRHALLEVDQFAGIIELVADDAAAAEPYLRRAYDGFCRMGLDTDTADTAALLARACLALDRDVEADELCSVSERLAGHGSKASIAWRSVRAHLLARAGAHDRAREVAEEAVSLAAVTDALVDHGDACLALATVLRIEGNTAGMRAAAEQAATLYDRKGAAALTEKARKILGSQDATRPNEVERPAAELTNACVDVGQRVISAINRKAWDEFEGFFSPGTAVESRRRIVGFTLDDLQRGDWAHQNRRIFEASGNIRIVQSVIAVRGEHLALSRLSVGSTDVSPGAPQDEFLQIYGIDDSGRVSLQVWFDIDEVDAALTELDAIHGRRQVRLENAATRAAAAEFDELNRPTYQFENAATRASDRLYACFRAQNWPALGEAVADDFHGDDRRPVIGVDLHGKEAVIASFRAVIEFGDVDATTTAIAVRGERLALTSIRYDVDDGMPAPFHVELLQLIETDVDERVRSLVTFDRDDISSAFEELEARYMAGEAADYAPAWSVIAGVFASLARQEIPASTSDWVLLDHRRGTPLANADLRSVVATMWDITPDLQSHIEKVHRLGDHGALCTQVSRGTTPEGFPAEWRMLNLTTIDGPLPSGCELFDEEDFEAAVARFQGLGRPDRRLENAATRLYERFKACFASQDWPAITEMLAEDLSSDDRRHVINTGRRQGRDAMVAELKALAEIGAETVTSQAIAIRGEHLVLSRVTSSPGHEAFRGDAIDVLELGPDERVVSRIVYDVDDIEAAYTELESRYLAREASAHAHAWSVIAGAYAAVLRHEPPPTTPDWVNVDHRRVTSFAPNELGPFLEATWDILANEITIYVEAVHRLSDIGAVVTRVIKGTSREGFTAEWREIGLSTVDGDRINRSEVFDEADLDAALAQFEELHQHGGLKNSASKLIDRYCAAFGARDWAAMAETLADDVITDDRRRVVNAGVRRGREVQLADSRAAAEVGGAQHVSSTVLAARGESLVLSHVRTINSNTPPGEFGTQMLGVIEMDSDNRIAVMVCFDDDDLDAALQELDARYLAGEASAYAQTWSTVLDSFNTINKGEVPEVAPGCINLDHRHAVAFAPGELGSYTVAAQTNTPDFKTYIEAVHRLEVPGAVVSYVAKGTSGQGFQAEWRGVSLSTVGGGLVDRVELYDEPDLEMALAQFDRLCSPTTQLENAATRADDQFDACFRIRDWDAMTALLTDGTYTDDRRRAVNGGIQRGLTAELENMRTAAGLGVVEAKTVPIAVRGQRLALSRTRFTGRDRGPGAFHSDLLGIVEVDDDQRIVARVIFDTDDFDAAFAELDAKYAAGEARSHAQTWSVVTRAYAALNRHEQFERDWIYADHRRGTPFASTSSATSTHPDVWEVTPNVNAHIEVVHRLTDGAVLVTSVVGGSSQDGFEAEWRFVQLLTVAGSSIERCELFDEADLEAALARFDGLSRSTPRLENAATRTRAGLLDAFIRRDLDAFCSSIAENGQYDDRRKGLRSTGSLRHEFVPTMLSEAPEGWQWTDEPIAIRGQRLALSRDWFRDTDAPSHPVTVDDLSLTEITEEGLVCHCVIFDRDDLGAAMRELDARWIASGEVEHPEIIEAHRRNLDMTNRHEWDALTAVCAGATYINHRQLGSTPADYITSIRTLASLAPDLSIESAEILAHSAIGVATQVVVEGTSAEGLAMEVPFLLINLWRGDHVTHIEAFDPDDRDRALARFDELSRTGNG